MAEMWDPLRRRNVEATPEEEVRQWFIGQLRDTMKVPVQLMNSEVGFSFGAKKYRADILVYDRQGQPLAVVECKRPDVRIDAAVSEQALRYNAVLSVRVIILTNGNSTYFFCRRGDVFEPCREVLDYERMLCQR